MLKRKVKRFTALALAAIITCSGAGPVYGVQGSENRSITMPDQEALEQCDYTLYTVKCGASDPDIVPAGFHMGALQTKTDQAYQEDESAISWGYVENGESLIYGKRDTDSSSLQAGLRYMSDSIKYDQDVSGITYRFQMPEGTREYEVILGCNNPWDARTADITLEGETVKEAWNLAKGSLSEEKFVVTVEDGFLDVWVHNPKRTSSAQDSMLSYIIVKVLYDQEYLKSMVENYTLTDSQRQQYSVQSLEKYDEAYRYANQVAETEEPVSYEKITSYLNKLIKKYDGLMKKNEPIQYTSISGTDGAVWLDNNGTAIQAHGGQVQQFTYKEETKWYWYGEDKTDGYRTVDGGVRVYSSTDLYDWVDEGVALRNLTDQYDFEEDYFKELYQDYTKKQKEKVLLAINDTTSVLERPKVIYNEKNDNYVMWFHADGPTETSNSNYAAASAGVAVSDSPTGPFRFIDRYRLNYVDGKHDVSKGMARDMNLFVDDDKTAYIIYSSEENATLFLSRLDEDYTYLSAPPEEAREGVDFLRSEAFAGQSREAPAMFQYREKYYLMTSGCTGWGANRASFAVSETGVMGEWNVIGDPCVTDTSICNYTNALTFGTQPTNIIPVDADKGKFIYMGDRWNNENPGQNELIDSRYVWLPVEFDGDGNMVLRPNADWTLNALDYMAPISVITELPTAIKKGTLLSELPQTITVSTNGEEKNTKVSWNVVSGDLNTTGPVTISGVMTDIGDRSVAIQAFVYSDELSYLVDCAVIDAANSPLQSPIFEEVSKHVELDHQVPDQKKTVETLWGWGAGCSSRTYSDGLGLYSTGWYGNENKKETGFSYHVTLDKGSYAITTGHTEWWSSARTTKVSASYHNGETLVTTQLGEAAWSSGNGGITKTVTGTIVIPKDGTEVTLTFTAGTDQAAVVSYIAIEKGNVIKVLDEISPVAVAKDQKPQLPETLNVETSSGQELRKPVKWDMDSGDFTALWSTVEVKGIVEGMAEPVTVKVEVVPEHLVYFIDSGVKVGEQSPAYEAVAMKQDLKNISADQVFDGTWGYEADKSKIRSSTTSDKFETGHYADKGQEIIYKFYLKAGTYRFASGYKEWWPQSNNGRSMNVSLIYKADGQDQAKDLGTVTLSKTVNGILDSQETTVIPSDGIVEFHVKKSGKLDVVLSWLAVYQESVSSGLTPVLHYDMAVDGSRVPDLSGQENHGILNNGSEANSVEKNGVSYLKFDGKNPSYITIPEGSVDGIKDITVSMLVNFTGDEKAVWAWTLGRDSGHYLFMSPYSSQGVLRAGVGNNEEGKGYSGEVSATGTHKLDAEEWNLVTITLSSEKKEIALYLDGEIAGTAQGIACELEDLLGDGLDGYIGKSFYQNDPYFTGNIADFRIYDGVADENEIQKLKEDADAEIEKLHYISPSDAVEADWNELMVPNIGDVRGNLTLSLQGENGSAITWESSDESIIAIDDLNEGTPIGVVTRPEYEQEVKLTAVVSLGTEEKKKEFTAVVKAAPEEKTFDAYLFAYFKGEGLSNGEQIYMAASQDGLNWSNLNDSKPVITSVLGEKGLRDPFIIRSAEGDKFYLIATDLKIYGNGNWNAAQTSGSRSIMVWESTDLLNWSDQRMIEVAADGAGCTWAPEAFYDETTGEYLVFWSSKIPVNQNVPNNDYTHRVYYAKTRDFYRFTEPAVWIELKNEDEKVISVIDATVIKVGDVYYRFTKNEASEPHKEGMPSGGKYTMLETSDSLLGEWTEIESDINTITGVEGATSFKINGEDRWCLLLDAFTGGGYFPMMTTDISSGSFTKLDRSEYAFPGTMRHGSVMALTKEEYSAVMEAMGPEETGLIESQDLTNTELMTDIIGSASPIYEDDFEEYEVGAAAQKGETLDDNSGNKHYLMMNDQFRIGQEENGNLCLEAAAISEIKLAQADITADHVAGLTDALIMMDVVIPGSQVNDVRTYAQIGTAGDRSYVKFDVKDSTVNIRENYNDSKADYTLKAGKSYHVAVLYKDGSAFVYVNGTLAHQKTSSIYGTVGIARIAVAAGGKIDHIKIYDASSDKSGFIDTLNEMKTIEPEGYNEESFAAFELALKKAEMLMESEVASMAELEHVFEELKSAYNVLEEDELEYDTSHIKITSKPYQTEYELYDEFNPEGMVVTAYQKASGSNAVKKVVLPEDAYDLEYDFSQLGDAEVMVSYHLSEPNHEENVFTDTIVVTVKEEIEEVMYYTSRIAITKDPEKRLYLTGEDFDGRGMEVTEYLKASASNASTRTRVLEEAEYDVEYDFSKEGKRKLTVVYCGTDRYGEERIFSDYMVVTVEEPGMKGYTTDIHITLNPRKTEYFVNDEMDTTGLVVKRIMMMDDGTTEEEILKTGSYRLSYDFSEIGQQTVTVLYIASGEYGTDELFQAEFAVTVKQYGSSDETSSEDNSSEEEKVSAEKPSYHKSGSWSQDENGWKFKSQDGSVSRNQWIYTTWGTQDNWYFFDEEGTMRIGWLVLDGRSYYLNPVSDGTRGHMVTGWHLIDGTWYYFNEISDGTRGALFTK